MTEEAVLAGVRAQGFILRLQISTVAQMVHRIVTRLLLVHRNDSRPIARQMKLFKVRRVEDEEIYLRAIVSKKFCCLRLCLLLKLVYMTAPTSLSQAIVPNRLLIPTNLLVHQGMADFDTTIDH